MSTHGNDPHGTHRPPHYSTDDPIDRALEHIQEAERDLIKEPAAAAERAEEELREAIEELKEARHAEVEIIVNGQRKMVLGHEISFEQVVKLAFPDAVPSLNVTFSVTYHRAASHPHASELALGGHVHIKEGTRFNVTRTIQS